MASEFDLICRHFTWPVRHTDLGGGDDAALFRVDPGRQLVVSTDMLVEGRHFFADTDPTALGWKTLAVNLSDIAAMGALARWALLSLALPDANEAWIAAFASGLRACAEAHDIDLIGGDTTRGPRTMNITVIGEVAAGTAVTRSGACAEDDLWVSGQPGRAALALRHLRDGLAIADTARDAWLDALHRPVPRVELGLALNGLASAMLDVSDGLLGDLGHILDASHTGAEIEAEALPLAPLIAGCQDTSAARTACLSGGDDYELLFTSPAGKRSAVLAAARQTQTPVHRIGRITRETDGLRLRHPDGRIDALHASGFDHFAAGD
jgi:thiamine-monophosphate kinase